MPTWRVEELVQIFDRVCPWKDEGGPRRVLGHTYDEVLEKERMSWVDCPSAEDFHTFPDGTPQKNWYFQAHRVMLEFRIPILPGCWTNYIQPEEGSPLIATWAAPTITLGRPSEGEALLFTLKDLIGWPSPEGWLWDIEILPGNTSVTFPSDYGALPHEALSVVPCLEIPVGKHFFVFIIEKGHRAEDLRIRVPLWQRNL